MHTTPLPLSSARWRELSHAYGTAGDIPALLRELPEAQPSSSYQDRPWYQLWSALCHQSDVYTASYAAVPHLIAAAATRPPEQRLDALHLAGSIEALRHRPVSPELPADIADAYLSSLGTGSHLALESLAADWDEPSFRALLGSLAAFRGFAAFGYQIADWEPRVDCPACGEEFLLPAYELFTESDEVSDRR